jgi:hypothetical protein
MGLNPAEGMDICLLWMLSVVWYRTLRRADHSSRGVLLNIYIYIYIYIYMYVCVCVCVCVCLSVIKEHHCEGSDPLGLSSNKKKQ